MTLEFIGPHRIQVASRCPTVGPHEVAKRLSNSIFARGRDTSRYKLEKRGDTKSNTRPPTRSDQILRLPVDPQRSKSTSQV